jgi:hypothetical protein
MNIMIKHLTLRDLGHYVVSFVVTVFVELGATNLPHGKEAWMAGIVGLAPVLFRQLSPDTNVTPGELTSAVGWLEELTEKMRATQTSTQGPTEAKGPTDVPAPAATK